MAKTYRHLYPSVCSFENLYLAWRKARLGKRSQPEVAAFEMDLARMSRLSPRPAGGVSADSHRRDASPGLGVTPVCHPYGRRGLCWQQAQRCLTAFGMTFECHSDQREGSPLAAIAGVPRQASA